MSGTDKHDQVDETGETRSPADEDEAPAQETASGTAEAVSEADRHHEETGADPSGEAPEERIRALEAEAAELKEQALRARAEVENVLRRTQREKQDIAAYAISDFARNLLPVADNLRRALEAVPAEQREEQHIKALAEGVEMTEKELLAALEKNGIRKVDPAGEKFDHNYHQAMAEVDAPDQAPGTVVDVYQPGYVIKDRLLRPAMVTVAKKTSQRSEGDSVDTKV